MRENQNYQPVDALFEVLTEWKPGSLSPEQVIDSIEVKIGRTIVGQERTDLESLAGHEIEYDVEIFGYDQSEPLRPMLINMNEEEWRD